MTTILRLADLQEANERLLAQAEAQFGPEITLDSVPVDEYSSVDLVAIYELTAESDLEMGSVADDLETLGELLLRPDEDVYVWHDLGHTANCSAWWRPGQPEPEELRRLRAALGQRLASFM